MPPAAAVPIALGNSMAIRAGVFMLGVLYGTAAALAMYYSDKNLNFTYAIIFSINTCRSSIDDANYEMILIVHTATTIWSYVLCSLIFTVFIYTTFITPIDLTQFGMNEDDIDPMMLLGGFGVACLCFVGWCIVMTACQSGWIDEEDEE